MTTLDAPSQSNNQHRAKSYQYTMKQYGVDPRKKARLASANKQSKASVAASMVYVGAECRRSYNKLEKRSSIDLAATQGYKIRIAAGSMSEIPNYYQATQALPQQSSLPLKPPVHSSHANFNTINHLADDAHNKTTDHSRH